MQLATGATVKYNVGGDGQGWRWSYYLPAILNGVNVLLNFLFYRPPPTRIQRKDNALTLFKSLDLLGFFLAIAGLVLLTIALVWGGNMYAWDSVHTLASLIVGVVILIFFGVYEWKGTNRGLLDHRLFKNRNFAILLALYHKKLLPCEFMISF
jgi:MFS family permease